ncbi:N-acetylmuramoyl-L-alanine amidase [Seinonella peptonophila]|uniref:N-acetylmuramoyl-L-alanine amidase n=1 Tax=Seinonella peptonophila TaxID=112248 RepID=A0A1M4VPR1_9BACL|nr:cell wall hydrolase [Seinonella peptonophila]SHE70949.1 N-acetylmuramoyl-L-alanine amidase [Seinonella peptonophila]
MAVVRHKPEEVQLLARLMRAEAEGEGDLGMLLVGNVSINRVRVDCLDFKDIRTITQMVFQSPGGYESVQKPYFYQAARARDIQLARQVIAGKRYSPAEFSLWFYRPVNTCSSTWFNQPFSGQYKNHCFYQPTQQNCPSVF